MATSSQRLGALVRRFRSRRIAVVGDLMLDRFIRGSVSRISPEAPVPVVEVNQPETQHPGGAGNVAANLAALGARPMMFGVVGKDAAGRLLRQELRRRGIAAGGVLDDSARPTTEKIRVIAGHQHLVRFDREAAAPVGPEVERRLLAQLERAVPRLDGVILSDYDKGVLTETVLARLLALCARREVPVFMDLKKARPLEGELRLLLVNQRRAEEVSGVAITTEKSLELVGRHLMARFRCQTLVITRGAAGMWVRDRDQAQRFEAVRAKPWEVFDVTGAGDTVMATLTLALVSGAPSEDAARLANAAAGVVVGRLGTAVCTPGELVAALTGS
jgi:D-beta-D-heptose 7-phosphate kinase/D-beta-D-heptose 1-phosphate adenosyltransferase